MRYLQKIATRAKTKLSAPKARDFEEFCMRLETTRLGFTYRITYVPKGARNPRAGLLRGADFAGVRHIEPAEAAPAFRIKWPKMDIWPLAFPRRPRAGTTGWIRKALTCEVLLFENVLWWPYLKRDYTGGGQFRACTAADCLERIKTDHYLFEMPETDDGSGVMKEPPKIRTLVETDYAEKLALSQRKTSENFLICGDRAYVRGGLPVYFRNSHFKKITWEIDIASIGADRRGDPKTHGLEDPPGSFQEHNTEQAFGSGAFWLPNEFAAAKSAGHRLQTKFPRIEVLMPDLIVDVRQQIRLDSLFREVVRMFSYPFCNHWSSRAVPSFRKRFKRLCDPVLDDRELSRRRLDLLRAFAARIRERDSWEMDRIRRDIISFDEQERCSPTWPETLAAEDDEALGSLGG
jgi:hypothetical protein